MRTMTAAVDIYPVVWKLHTLGYSLIPSGGGDTGKAPRVPWARYQDQQPTDTELHTWQDSLRPKLWGIVTGKVVVFDCDTAEAAKLFEAAGLKPHVRTPRGGSHFYFASPGFPVKTVAGLLPGVDSRGNGGFVNVVGSNGPGAYVLEIMPTPDNLYAWDQLPLAAAEALKAKPKATAEAAEPVGGLIPETRRNHTLLSLAGTMRKRGMTQAAIEAALLETNRQQCRPPLTEDEVRKVAASGSRYTPDATAFCCGNVALPGVEQAWDQWLYTRDNNSPPDASFDTERNKSATESAKKAASSEKSATKAPPLIKRVSEWTRDQKGWFSYVDMDRELGIRSDSEKSNRRLIMSRLRVAGEIEQHPKDSRLFRHVDTAVRPIDFKRAGSRTPLDLRWPFGIERMFKCYPGNVIVIAGAPDAGKTAFLLNFVYKNMRDFAIFYQSSEMGETELASRLELFDGTGLEEWTFTAEERSSDFPDVIRPEAVNIIDFLEVSGEFYIVGEWIRQIHEKLRGGIAIIALQKNPGASLGRGGSFGLEKPRLYLNMDAGKVAVRKCKNWVNPEKNPNGLELDFKLMAGCRFTTTRDWHHPEAGQ